MQRIKLDFTNLSNGDHFTVSGIVEEKEFELLKRRVLLDGIASLLPKSLLVVPSEELPVIVGFLRLEPSKHRCWWKDKLLDLTVTEFLLLQSMARRAGHVRSRNQLMDDAYGEHIYVDDRTIDSHIKRLRAKFRFIDKEFSEIETLYGVGYRYREPLSSIVPVPMPVGVNA